MTLIAGIISRKPNAPLPASICETLQRVISRDERDVAEVFSGPQSFFVQINIGAFGEAAVIEDEHGSTFLAGEPLLDSDADLAEIHRGLPSGDTQILGTANGVFSVVHYQAGSGELKLVADKLGLRPLYYWFSDDLVIFASALRILEAVAEIPKRMDVRAVTEMVGLGYPLDDRTPYAGIYLLRAAEIVTFSGDKISGETYWHWDQIEASERSESELLSDLYANFSKAVASRNRGDRSTAAYLSGGLDSRCIVAELRTQNVDVHTFNFSRAATQDQAFGHEFAKVSGSLHQELPKQAGDLVPDYSRLMADVWAAKQAAGAKAERPNIVWSGEGGSVALGHVHLTEEMAEMLRRGETDSAIEEHLRREFAQVSPKLFRPDIATKMSTIIHQGIREELARFGCKDAARSFYLHLLLNDQHRKLGKHFENIDLHRLEFHMPFFDSSFIAAILSVPLDICLRHRLYVKLLALFPPYVTSVPWQVYPGHEPCPVPVPEGLSYQWANSYQTAESVARKRIVMEQAATLFGKGAFPDAILNKRNLRLARWAHATGLRDYGYLIGPASVFFEYWNICGGDFYLP